MRYHGWYMKSCHMGIMLSSFAFNITVWRPKWSWDILTSQVLKIPDLISWNLRGNPAFTVEPTQTRGKVLSWEYCSCSLAVLDPRVGHTMDVLSPFIPCHSDWLFHGESCPRLDVVHPGRAWPSSPSCTWHCSLHYLFLQATPLFPHCVAIVC